MLDEKTVYAKTQKGLLEVATRACRLSPRLRSLLIIIDGNITTATLIDRAAMLGQSQDSLATLVTEGFIADRDNLNQNVSAVSKASAPAKKPKQVSSALTTPVVQLVATDKIAPVIKQDATMTAAVVPQPRPVPVPAVAVTTASNASADNAPFDEASWFGDATPTKIKTTSTSRRSLAIARLYLIDSMERMYGNSSVAIRDELRHATTKDAILLQLAHCVEIVAEGADTRRAEEFRQRVIDLLPQ